MDRYKVQEYLIDKSARTFTVDQYVIKLDFFFEKFPGHRTSEEVVYLTEIERDMLIKEFNKSMTHEPTLAEMIHEKIESDALAGRTVPEILASRSQAERKPKQKAVKNSIEQILEEREKTHGNFETHAGITGELKIGMKCSPNWHKLSFTQKEALDMIAHKIGRILAGDPNEKDHWDDIAGYATLVSKELDQKKLNEKDKGLGEY